MKTLLHVDMDAFFASVEQAHHPEWRGCPVVVGAGPHERGVVSTCSYEARRFGIRSAMPSRIAYARCPSAVFVRPDMKLYRETSDRVFEVFSHYSPYVEAVSIDEAFLDITGTLHLYRNDPQHLAETLRREIRTACGVTCSVGIAPNRLLAKIGSEQRKPDGLTVMPFDRDAIADFLAPKSLGILWGVGARTLELLRPYGLVTCGDIQRLCRKGPGSESAANVPEALNGLLGENAATSLVALAFGISSDDVHWEESEEKSVSREHTFEEDVIDRETVRATLLELVGEVGHRFRRRVRWARTAKLKFRDADFNTLTRQVGFPHPSRDDIALRTAALDLFDAVWPEGRSRTVRLIGFGVANLQDSPEVGEPSLFANPDDAVREKRERLSAALDALRDRGLL